MGLIKDYGLRPIEISHLTLKDFDLQQNIMYVRTAKRGKARAFKLKPQTLAMLKHQITLRQPKLNQKLFCKPSAMRVYFDRLKRKVAKRLCKPELLSIRFYDLRHFYGSMLYYKTKDLLYVKNRMGHRSINSTLTYTHLVNFESDEYNVKVASTLEECTKLLEAGFHT